MKIGFAAQERRSAITPHVARAVTVFLALCCAVASLAQARPPRRAAPEKPAAPAATAAAPSSDEQDVVDLEKHILDFIRAKNSKDLEPWISDDFQYLDASGNQLNREQFLGSVKSVQGYIDWLSADDMHVRIFGNLAVVTGVQQSQVSQTPPDVIATGTTPAPVASRSAFTDVFRRRASTWELVMVYAATLPQTSEAAPAGQAPAAQSKPTAAAPKPSDTAPKKPSEPDDRPILRKPPGQ